MRQDMEMEDKDSGHLRYYFSWQFHMFKFQAKNKLLLFQMSCQEKVSSSGIIYLNADIIIQHLNLPGQDIDRGKHLMFKTLCEPTCPSPVPYDF